MVALTKQAGSVLPNQFGRFRVAYLLGQGTSGTVFEAVDPATGRHVAIKTVQTLGPDSLTSFRREIQTLSALRHPGVVRILDHGGAAGHPWYAMELLQGETLRTRLDAAWGSPPRPDGLLACLAAVADILATLHVDGIVHGDLKPENVLIDATGHPILVDFEFASRVPRQGRELLADRVGFSGTPRYMAPEQIVGGPIDERIDLYALGCMLFEALTGAPPFTGEDAATILHHHLSSPAPRPSSKCAAAAPFDPLVLALLAKDPGLRIARAEDVIATLKSLGVPCPAPRARRPAAVRLYRPTLVGRRAALATLAQAMDRARAGSGSLVVLEGESGIGKTAVASEVVRRFSDGFLVVTSTCTALGGMQRSRRTDPLGAFRPVLCAAADHRSDANAALPPEQAILLAQVEPELRSAFGVEAGIPAPDLGADGARERLFDALASVLDGLAARVPVLVVIDDLQWADELSIAFLATRPAGWLAARRIVVVATARSDEHDDALAAIRTLADAHFLALGRLTVDEIQRLVAGLLSLAETPTTLAAFLGRHAQGNPYFVAEYIRAALEDGVLERTQARTLRIGGDDHVVSTQALERLRLPATLHALLQRRLARLGVAATRLLEIASAAGRETTDALLAATAGLDEPERLAGVAELLARQVIEETAPGCYRFVHDALVEAAYDRIPADRRRQVHAEIATALEACSQAGSPAILARLAHHWAEAGDEERTLCYLDLAGRAAVSSALYADGADLLRRALALDQVRVRDGRGGRPAPVRARWQLDLARAELGLGDAAASEADARAALETLGERLPAPGGSWRGLITREAMVQLAHLLRLGAHRMETGAADTAVAAASLLAFRYFCVDDMAGSIGTSIVAVNRAERVRPPLPAPRGYVALASTVGALGLRRLAARYFERAHQGAAALHDAGESALALVTESVQFAQRGAWARAEALTRDAMARFGDADPFTRELIQVAIGHVEYFTGRLEEALARYDDVLRSARARGSVQRTAWALFSKARSLVALGRDADALPMLEEARGLLDRQPESQSEIICLGLLARACWRLGRLEAAREAADACTLRIRRTAPAGFPPLVGHCAVLDAYIGLMDAGGAAGAELERIIASIARRLERMARFVPVARPAAAYYRGELARRRGRLRPAARAFRSALTQARRYGMPGDAERALAACLRMENDT